MQYSSMIMSNYIQILSVLFIVISSFVFRPAASSSDSQTDLLSLLAIKTSLQDPQGALNSWNQTLHFCRWSGVQCDGRNPNRVVALNLSSQGLVGNLSPHVGNLSFLKVIILSYNTFRGHIPSQITLLRRLEVIDFSSNQFEGMIHMNLSQCVKLVKLVLIKNFLSGKIPAELGLLPRLEDLSLTRNLLSGAIPPSIGNLTTLTWLSLGSNGFIGEIPDSFSQLHRLEFLQLSENNLTGNIPPGIFNLSKIFYFDVSVNQLHGALPSTIGLTLPNLACLVLEKNQFTGKIPYSIANASLIEWIVLSSNYFAGPIPDLSRLMLISDFFLKSNLIVDNTNFISSLTNSTNLERLDVGNNMLTGSLPESISNLSSLLTLMNMDNNKIHGSMASGIGSLASLRFVNLSHNFLNGPLPTSLSMLSNMHTLILGGNRITGELPSSFGNLTLLSRLHLDGNELFGSVPSNLGNCYNLLELDLSDNNFAGLIPPEIMKLQLLSIVLNLSHNGFVGSIPEEVGSLRKLASLDLSRNRLSGKIPNTISNCDSLETLNLSENLLEGEIPSGLSGLMGLQDLNLSFNRLHGEVPSRGVFGNVTSISLGGNQGLCGGVSNLKLPPCSVVESSKRNLSTLMKIMIPILVLVVGGLCIVLLVFCSCKQKNIAGEQTSLESSLDNGIGIKFLRLSYADLQRATNDFSKMNMLGYGRFGSVYRGLLNDETTLVAIKVVNLGVRGASKTFIAECKALGGIRHRNLVRLLTVCDSIDFKGNEFKALVYEFKVNGSLDKWLHREKSSGKFRNLSMLERLNIAIDIARGIHYLHRDSGSCIVHGDLKPSNILLDQEMVACVGDFGLAKIVSSVLPSFETSSSSMGIKGTLGYVPPEYGTFGTISMEGDVYSYGVILLEMFTNKRPTDDLFHDHLNLHSFVRAALPDRAMEVVDQELQMGPDSKREKLKNCMINILSIGMSCSQEIAKDRMSITDVLDELCDIKSCYLSEKKKI